MASHSPRPRAILLERSQSFAEFSKVAASKAGEYESFRKSEQDIQKIKNKRVRAFYDQQNQVLDQFHQVDNILRSTPTPTNGCSSPVTERTPLLGTLESQVQLKGSPSPSLSNSPALIKLIINLNFVLNFALFAGKVVAVLASSSISLVASLIDSAMDLLSTLIIWFAHTKSEEGTVHMRFEYPSGRHRFEPMGVAVFSAVMITSFAQVFIESIQRLIDNPSEPALVPMSGIIAMVFTISTKLFVWLSCRNMKNVSIKALAQDAENDVIFNFISLLFPYIGQRFHLVWLDPLGGAVLSLYIIYEWFQTLTENVRNLTGKRGSAQDYQRVLYLVTRFDDLIQGIHHVEVFRSGDELICEVDIILPSTTSLPVAHDIGEGLQYALENLEGVSRAYVHCDYLKTNPSSHVKK